MSPIVTLQPKGCGGIVIPVDTATEIARLKAEAEKTVRETGIVLARAQINLAKVQRGDRFDPVAVRMPDGRQRTLETADEIEEYIRTQLGAAQKTYQEAQKQLAWANSLAMLPEPIRRRTLEQRAEVEANRRRATGLPAVTPAAPPPMSDADRIREDMRKRLEAQRAAAQGGRVPTFKEEDAKPEPEKS